MHTKYIVGTTLMRGRINSDRSFEAKDNDNGRGENSHHTALQPLHRFRYRFRYVICGVLDV